MLTIINRETVNDENVVVDDNNVSNNSINLCFVNKDAKSECLKRLKV